MLFQSLLYIHASILTNFQTKEESFAFQVSFFCMSIVKARSEYYLGDSVPAQLQLNLELRPGYIMQATDLLVNSYYHR